MWLTYLQIIGSLLFIQRPDYIQNSYFFDKPFHNAFWYVETNALLKLHTANLQWREI